MNTFNGIIKSIQDHFSVLKNQYEKSKKWKEYHLGPTFTHCDTCVYRNGKIYDINDLPKLPEHEKCVCYLEAMKSIRVGSATKLGKEGADYFLKHYNKLPDYYLTKEQAMLLGWVGKKGNLNLAAPNKMIGGNRFFNREDRLPDAPNRIWYECDIDYNSNFRNSYRLVYSNDGLIFKTDSHFKSFIAVEG